MAINWFPGHMKKTQREIKENLKLVDAVIEIRDARIPRSSANPDIDSLLQGKPRIILLNKSDLTEGKVTKEWIKHLTKDDVKVLEVNCLKGDGLKAIKPMLLSLLKEKHDRLRAKGMVNITTRVMVVGIPNVGKSTFINKMARNSIAKTGDRPGVTKSKQWIKTSIGIELLDTPGVLWPRFEDEETALNLAFTGAIKDEIMDIEELSYKLVERLQSFYKDNLKERYKIDEVSEDPLETLNAIAKKRGTLVSGGEINYNRIAVILLDEFRAGRIGKISLERPGKINE
ncbi:ribosome biogenesis GTPase YlqF [Clostridium botulinum]|uniref:ribosome biogenesis GTPase YlqF n=1 Tax=Clostridium TaxID=1485 RepID=UPI000504F169|nr:MULTISPECIES: ribosome biogenesis GTPase YlqF [unclassified Clostridium]AIY79379.1 ribosome biogenesis GTP-binding protein YlqF [Clostridium botulinum 202F]KAI3348603.1 ribosome biogenesis GTPase YlqF [Clostridium botulinum]KFX58284.1 GTPase [Clostridium botulinum]KON12578.1 GTPase [Clostridium botulinum]MBN1038174.1 ribosome biogenesis GTPase YlqF [Clostridium botulinum]